nr:reverse transcriptase domain-containing protein [Tanacetum cinerariifolium]
MTSGREDAPPLGFSTLTPLPSPNVSELPPITTYTFTARSSKNTPLANRASTSANPEPMISPDFEEANYESIVRRKRWIQDRRMVVDFKDAPNKDGSRVERESDGRRPLERRTKDDGSYGVNLPLLFTAYLGRSENGQPLKSTLTYGYGGNQPSINSGAISLLTDYPILNGLKMPSHMGSYDGKGDPDNYLHLIKGDIDLPTTYKGLMEKTYNWIKAKEVAINGALSDHKEGFNRALRVDSKIPIVGFSGEHSWPLEEVPLEVTVGESPYVRIETLNFVIVRPNSPDNLLLERTVLQKIGGKGQNNVKETTLEATKNVLSLNVEERIIGNDKYPKKKVIQKQLPTSFKRKLQDGCAIVRLGNGPVSEDRLLYYVSDTVYGPDPIRRIKDESTLAVDIDFTWSLRFGFVKPDKLPIPLSSASVEARISLIMFEFSSCLFADSAMNLVSDSSKVCLQSGYEEFPLLLWSAEDLLRFNTDAFSWTYADMTEIPRTIMVGGNLFNTEHKLNEYKHIKPVKQKKWGLALEQNEAASKEVDELTKAGILREVKDHTWVANPIMILILYRKLSEKWNPSRGFDLNVFLDAYKGYYQIQIAEGDKEKTNFFTGKGVFYYRKMPFGLKNAGVTYQRLVDKVFNNQIEQNLKAYVDDMVIKSTFEEDMLMDIQETFDRLRSINMKLNPKKCSFNVEEGPFLGHLITKQGIKANPLKVKEITYLKPPRTLKEIQILNGKLAALS